ncbi:MAG: hypothetical protein Pg6C_03890 [Treponemataceae bacterium]|nr:MAG: hypothetical protein Pg6C_03890 [Treponemataceae bacterium]
MNKRIIGMAAVLVMAVLASCASKATVDKITEILPPPSENNTSVAAIKSTVLDWNNRNMGEQPYPAWLRGLVINHRQSAVRQEFELPDNAVVRASQAERANRDEARVEADLNFAQQIANELKRYVVTAAAKRLDTRQMDIVEQVTSTTKVTMTGAQKLADFWQRVEKNEDGVKSRTYIWYTVYAFPGDTWGKLTRKYVSDVIGQIPDRPVQTQIAQAFDEIDAEARRNNERSDAEFRQQLQLQMQAAQNKQKQDMARINQQTAATAAGASVAKTQAQAEADARYAAYKYGDAATAAAATTVAGDIDWISALNTSASIGN